jgi:5,6-dimethylbenzimidazole synthase
MSESPHGFDQSSRDAVYRAIHGRRDVRQFLPDPVDAAALQRIFAAAHAAPSVGLSQPWRFVRITCPELRAQIHKLVREERERTAQALGPRRDEFLRLKVEGIAECAELVVAAVCDGGRQEVFGRRTLPQMDLASTACAIQNLWLAARAEGLGVGWVSMFDPEALASLLELPGDTRPIAVLCIGHVAAFDPIPRLTIDQWRVARPLEELMRENRWGAETGL